MLACSTTSYVGRAAPISCMERDRVGRWVREGRRGRRVIEGEARGSVEVAPSDRGAGSGPATLSNEEDDANEGS